MVKVKKVGFIVNPIAGMGGSVGLKGTDDVVQKAIELGAVPRSPHRAMEALGVLSNIRNDIEIVTCSSDMGENEAKQYLFATKVVWKYKRDYSSSDDTKNAAQAMLREKVDIILFTGGDGTARDIFKAVEEKVPVIGIPAGVKIHSPVYARNPRKAGELAKLYLTGKIKTLKEVEVLDINENEYRAGRVDTQLFGYLKIPYEKNYVQNRKAPTPLSEAVSQKAIALDVIDNMEDDIFYIIGPGTTTRAVMEEMSLSYTLLGVDVICNKQLVAMDVTEKQLKDITNKNNCKLIITPIGGQGYLLGRGNQQISSGIVRSIGKKNIIVITTKQKISELRGRPFLVDTGDIKVDKMLSGYIKALVGYKEQVIYPIDY